MTERPNRPTPGSPPPQPAAAPVSLAWSARCVFGGVLMGLANLVPGISGGTMLLAAGVYPAFIDGLADVTRLRFSWRSLLVLGLIGGSAAVGILLLAGTLKQLVVDYRWAMYSLFIGLTLGGVPLVWRLATDRGVGFHVSALVSICLMAGLALMESRGIVLGGGGSGPFGFALAGLAGASAMILPGLSGGYLLLLMGKYVPILAAISEFKEALQAGDLAAASQPAIEVMLPVGIGVVVGIAVVGNLLKWLLDRFRTPTLGVLLGLLLGSVFGLYPFQVGVPPQPGDEINGQIVTLETLATIGAEDWPTAPFVPTLPQVAGSVAILALGLALTAAVGRLGRAGTPDQRDDREAGEG